MPTYRIPLIWKVSGNLYIEAENVEEAKEIALAPETALPDKAEYLMDSEEVDEEGIEED